jgi:hypothetical protein
MKDKRVILNISGELHSKLKQYADKDERTLNVVLRKILLAGVNVLNIDLENSLKVTGTITQEEREITQYGSVLTSDQRGYFKQNPSKTLEDYCHFLVDSGHKPVKVDEIFNN